MSVCVDVYEARVRIWGGAGGCGTLDKMMMDDQTTLWNVRLRDKLLL